jgi:hypothetical protein
MCTVLYRISRPRRCYRILSCSFSNAKLLSKTIKNSLAALDKDLKNTEAKITEIIDEDENLKKLYKLITSVVVPL